MTGYKEKGTMRHGDPITAPPEESESLAQLAKILGSSGLSLSTTHGGHMELPETVERALETVVGQLMSGNSVLITPVEAELTPRQAGEMLGVSRPYLMKMIKQGELPSRRVGKHHRIKLSDVLAYRHARYEGRKAILDELAADSEALGIR